MPTPGKNFPGQKGFPTPNDTPDDTVRRIFIVPNNEDWLGLLEGAAQVLLDEWRYYDWGALTPAETVAAFNDVILASYTNICQCEQPSGAPVFRLNPHTGRIEELLPDNTWGDPAGDYALPDTPARTEPTPEERLCAAAANAANTLQTLYESISDSFSSGLSYDAAVLAAVAIIAGTIGFVFGIVVAPLIGIFALLFGTVFATVEFVTADRWDSAFTAKLICVLLSCANDTTGDVVHFDLACVLDTLAHGTAILDPTPDQLLLFGQIYTILNMLGAQSLDAMGATTAITSPDCSGCVDTWEHTWDFTLNDNGFDAISSGGVLLGTYIAASGWEAVASAGNTSLAISALDVPPTNYTSVTWRYTSSVALDALAYATFVYNTTGGAGTRVVTLTENHDGLTGVRIDAYVLGDPGASILLTSVTVRGTGTNPFI